MQYRRARIQGGTYFFTVVTRNRHNIFAREDNIDLLRRAFQYVMQNHPFRMDAHVILPDHLHYNPVKHGLVESPIEWTLSSIHRYVNDGLYSRDWGTSEPLSWDDGVGKE